MNEFAFHPEAEADLIEIWDFIAEDNVDGARCAGLTGIRFRTAHRLRGDLAALGLIVPDAGP